MIWTKTFTMAPDEYAERVKQVSDAGVPIAGVNGAVPVDLHKYGGYGTARIGYDYDGTQVTVDLMECPFVERGRVESKITEWFQQPLRSQGAVG